MRDRDAFLQAVAEALQGRQEIGDGDVDRALRAALAEWADQQLAYYSQERLRKTTRALPSFMALTHHGRPSIWAIRLKGSSLRMSPPAT